MFVLDVGFNATHVTRILTRHSMLIAVYYFIVGNNYCVERCVASMQIGRTVELARPRYELGGEGDYAFCNQSCGRRHSSPPVSREKIVIIYATMLGSFT